ncbi:LysE/ArgO family amino acid transporter [Leucothrix pacifica]|uniref:Amino acid transporter n=1 Tax=Leucothrix pacifica TaxID=1247513 RepID=A0A317CBH4_9GAMM|nr:LysE/ArgO family amino acid transporter [Leucothrix pacifica]PWQ96045.1 amino acid transporter [Leucothrix pacifica]
MSVSAAVQGFGIGAGLIIAIGSQNAFVLSCSLRNQHAYAVAALCALIDIVLIHAGVWGLGVLIKQSPVLLSVARYGGAAFLFLYGFYAFRRAFKPESLQAEAVKPMSLKAALLMVLALSLLNPHVYLDTVILLGSIGGQLPNSQPAWFAIGASAASIVWFGGLAFAGKKLGPWFDKPSSWQRLDFLIGAVMWAIAINLLFFA